MKKLKIVENFYAKERKMLTNKFLFFADDYQSKFSMYIYFLCTHFRKSVDDENSGFLCFKITFCNASKMHTQKY